MGFVSLLWGCFGYVCILLMWMMVLRIGSMAILAWVYGVWGNGCQGVYVAILGECDLL